MFETPASWSEVLTSQVDGSSVPKVWMIKSGKETLRTIDLIKEVLPEKLKNIRVSSTGKPYILGADESHFSVSNQQGMALFATSIDGPVGVDLERYDSRRLPERIIEYKCTPFEKEWLLKQCFGSEMAAFLELWVAKEAVSKSLDFDMKWSDIEIDSNSIRELQVSRLPKEIGEGTEVTLRRLELPEGWVGYVANVIYVGAVNSS